MFVAAIVVLLVLLDVVANVLIRDRMEWKGVCGKVMPLLATESSSIHGML